MNVCIVDKNLKIFIQNKVIEQEELNESMVQPASIDLPVGKYAYLMKRSTIPINKSVREIIERDSIEKLDLTTSKVLLKGYTYIIEGAKLNLPENIQGITSPKSSIGRIDLFVRVIGGKKGYYDIIEPGFKGEIFLEVTPISFNVKIETGIQLTQIRFMKNKNINEPIDYENTLFNKNNEKIEINKIDKNIIMHLDLKNKEFVGYEAKETNEVIDLSKVKAHKWEKYFKKIKVDEDESIILEKDKFYILNTAEKIQVKEKYSVEMMPFSHNIGELRAHYAGFFDPGFGIANKGDIGVLEIRSSQTMTIYDKQPICSMKFFLNEEIPEKTYGLNNNNYQGQKGPKLSKYFK